MLYSQSPTYDRTGMMCVTKSSSLCCYAMIAVQSTYLKSGCLSLLLFVIFFYCIFSNYGLGEILQFNRIKEFFRLNCKYLNRLFMFVLIDKYTDFLLYISYLAYQNSSSFYVLRKLIWCIV